MCIDYSQFVYYDETSPSGLRWKVDVRSGRGYTKILIKAGDVAGTKEDGYWHCQISKKRVYNHRVIWVLHGNTDTTIDHINGDRFDNRITNLRAASKKENMQNLKKFSTNTSGVTGVNYSATDNRWRAEWRKTDGNNTSKSFSVVKYGYDKAFELACEFRAKMIEELNFQGASYTERHGK